MFVYKPGLGKDLKVRPTKEKAFVSFPQRLCFLNYLGLTLYSLRRVDLTRLFSSSSLSSVSQVKTLNATPKPGSWVCWIPNIALWSWWAWFLLSVCFQRGGDGKTSHDRTHFRKGDDWHWNNFLAENRETHSFQRSEGLFIARLLTLRSEIVTSWAKGLRGLQD